MFRVKRRGEDGWRWGFAGYQCSSSSPGSTALTWVQSDGIKEQQGELTEGNMTLTNTLADLGQTDVIMIRNGQTMSDRYTFHIEIEIPI